MQGGGVLNPEKYGKAIVQDEKSYLYLHKSVTMLLKHTFIGKVETDTDVSWSCAVMLARRSHHRDSP